MFGESSGGGDGTSSGWLAMAKARGDINEYIQCMAAILSMILNTSVQVGAVKDDVLEYVKEVSVHVNTYLGRCDTLS